jgi:hypothetical protein
MGEELVFETTVAMLLGREFQSIIHFYDYCEITEQRFPQATSEQRPTTYFYVALTPTGCSVMDGGTPSHRLIVVNRMELATSVQKYARLIDRGDFDRIYGIADEGYMIDRPEKLKELLDLAVCYRADLLAVDDSLFSDAIRNELLKESSELPLWAECRIISSQFLESLS